MLAYGNDAQVWQPHPPSEPDSNLDPAGCTLFPAPVMFDAPNNNNKQITALSFALGLRVTSPFIKQEAPPRKFQLNSRWQKLVREWKTPRGKA